MRGSLVLGERPVERDPSSDGPRRPRVARVATSISLNLILRRQMDVLRETGYDVVCVCDDDDWAQRLREGGYEVWPLGMGRRPSPLAALRWGLAFYRQLKQDPVDIVHCHNAFHGVIGRLAARLAGVPVVAQTVHNWWYLEPDSSLRARVYRWLERAAGLASDVVFFINHEDRQNAVARGILREQQCIWIGNGIDVDAFERDVESADRESMRAELGLGRDDVAVTMIARLEPPKDHALFLAAFQAARLRDPRLHALLVGYGLREDEIRSRVDEIGLTDAVSFLGYRDDIAAVLTASDILVLASRQEGFGRCLVEAMLADVPVVATDVIGVRDVVRHLENGLLVPYPDPVALTAAIESLVGETELRARLVAAAHADAHARFDEGTPALRIAAAYGELLASKARR